MLSRSRSLRHRCRGAARPFENPAPVRPRRDHMRRLLLVQAQEEGMRLFTRDAKLVGPPCAVVGRE